jgi:hypothetical protein
MTSISNIFKNVCAQFDARQPPFKIFHISRYCVRFIHVENYTIDNNEIVINFTGRLIYHSSSQFSDYDTTDSRSFEITESNSAANAGYVIFCDTSKYYGYNLENKDELAFLSKMLRNLTYTCSTLSLRRSNEHKHFCKFLQSSHYLRHTPIFEEIVMSSACANVYDLNQSKLNTYVKIFYNFVMSRKAFPKHLCARQVIFNTIDFMTTSTVVQYASLRKYLTKKQHSRLDNCAKMCATALCKYMPATVVANILCTHIFAFEY